MTVATHRIFVCGTMLRGEPGNRVLERGGAKLLGATRAGPGFYLYGADRPAPYLVHGVCKGTVAGELYEVSDALLVHLDSLEQHPTRTRREWIRLIDGSTAQAYVTPFGGAHLGSQLIPGGDWLAARRAWNSKPPVGPGTGKTL